MIETGTAKDFKDCVLDQLWIWNLECGHKMIAGADFRAEFERLSRRQMQCPVCAKQQEMLRNIPPAAEMVILGALNAAHQMYDRH